VFVIRRLYIRDVLALEPLLWALDCSHIAGRAFWRIWGVAGGKTCAFRRYRASG